MNISYLAEKLPFPNLWHKSWSVYSSKLFRANLAYIRTVSYATRMNAEKLIRLILTVISIRSEPTKNGFRGGLNKWIFIPQSS